jgi:hypothetical protein
MGVQRSKLFETERFEGEEKMRDYESKLEMLYRAKHTKLSDELLILNDKKGLLEGELKELEAKMPKLKNISSNSLSEIKSKKLEIIKQNAPTICKPTAPEYKPIKAEPYVPTKYDKFKVKKVDFAVQPKVEPFVPRNIDSSNKQDYQEIDNEKDQIAKTDKNQQQSKWVPGGFSKSVSNTENKTQEEVWD